MTSIGEVRAQVQEATDTLPQATRFFSEQLYGIFGNNLRGDQESLREHQARAVSLHERYALMDTAPAAKIEELLLQAADGTDNEDLTASSAAASVMLEKSNELNPLMQEVKLKLARYAGLLAQATTLAGEIAGLYDAADAVSQEGSTAAQSLKEHNEAYLRAV